jgi:hypothetical protein
MRCIIKAFTLCTASNVKAPTKKDNTMFHHIMQLSSQIVTDDTLAIHDIFPIGHSRANNHYTLLKFVNIHLSVLNVIVNCDILTETHTKEMEHDHHGRTFHCVGGRSSLADIRVQGESNAARWKNKSAQGRWAMESPTIGLPSLSRLTGNQPEQIKNAGLLCQLINTVVWLLPCNCPGLRQQPQSHYLSLFYDVGPKNSTSRMSIGGGRSFVPMKPIENTRSYANNGYKNIGMREVVK